MTQSIMNTSLGCTSHKRARPLDGWRLSICKQRGVSCEESEPCEATLHVCRSGYYRRRIDHDFMFVLFARPLFVVSSSGARIALRSDAPFQVSRVHIRRDLDQNGHLVHLQNLSLICFG
jgi:hypothetical protein